MMPARSSRRVCGGGRRSQRRGKNWTRAVVRGSSGAGRLQQQQQRASPGSTEFDCKENAIITTAVKSRGGRRRRGRRSTVGCGRAERDRGVNSRAAAGPYIGSIHPATSAQPAEALQKSCRREIVLWSILEPELTVEVRPSRSSARGDGGGECARAMGPRSGPGCKGASLAILRCQGARAAGSRSSPTVPKSPPSFQNATANDALGGERLRR